MVYLALHRTLWSRGQTRCVLVQQPQPPLLAVQVFQGSQAVYTELVESLKEAFDVASEIWPSSDGLTLPQGLDVAKTKRRKRLDIPEATADVAQIMAAILDALPPPSADKNTRKSTPTKRRGSGTRKRGR